MRARSSAIIAEDFDDYIKQLDNEIIVPSSNDTMIQLFNFDYLSLDNSCKSTQDEDEYSDALSSNSFYKLKVKKATEALLSNNQKKPLIPIKSKRLVRKKRGLIKKMPQNFETTNGMR